MKAIYLAPWGLNKTSQPLITNSSWLTFLLGREGKLNHIVHRSFESLGRWPVGESVGGITPLAPQVNQHGGVDHGNLETAHPLSVVYGKVVRSTLVVALVDKRKGRRIWRKNKVYICTKRQSICFSPTSPQERMTWGKGDRPIPPKAQIQTNYRKLLWD